MVNPDTEGPLILKLNGFGLFHCSHYRYGYGNDFFMGINRCCTLNGSCG